MEAGPLAELDGWARELLDSARVAHLGLLDDRDRPRVLPVTFAVAGGCVWSAIDRKPKRADREPARLRFLRRNPAAALTVDRYDDDWSRLAWVQVLGEVSLLRPAEAPKAMTALCERYGQYTDEPPPGPLLRLAPSRTLAWRASSGEG